MQANSLLNAASAWFSTFPEEEKHVDGERSLGLLKPKPQLAVKDSNMANFGTKIEYDIKAQAAQGEKAWTNAGKAPGLQVWRVNKFKMESVADVGSFYAGDSYVVLSTKKTPKPDVFSYDVHFWLGSETTQDEAGTAAYKTVELDDYLKRAAVQHREVQGHESEAFLSYFSGNGGIRILQGGADTGFNRVKPTEYRPRLLQIKGKKLLRVKEVPLSASSLNSGDVFILDNGLQIYQWSGLESSPKEKGRGAQLTRSMSSERDGKAAVIVEQQGKESDNFWKALGGKGPINPAALGGLDDEEEKTGVKRLFRLSDATGKLVLTLLGEGALDRNLLNSDDAFILDTGAEVVAWLGSKCSQQEKLNAPKYSADYMRTNNRPSYLPLTVLREGATSNTFELSFDKNSKARELILEDSAQANNTSEVGEERVFKF